jgi:hypothetical protein
VPTSLQSASGAQTANRARLITLGVHNAYRSEEYVIPTAHGSPLLSRLRLTITIRCLNRRAHARSAPREGNNAPQAFSRLGLITAAATYSPSSQRRCRYKRRRQRGSDLR